MHSTLTYIGSICHIYIDGITIWLQILDEHCENITKVLEVLYAHVLYCSLKKTTLFTNEFDFLSHHISHRSIEANGKKVNKIL